MIHHTNLPKIAHSDDCSGVSYFVIYLFLFFITTARVLSQTEVKNGAYDLEIICTDRVQLQDEDVYTVFMLWKRHLMSRPDSVYVRNYWSERELTISRDVDLLRPWIFTDSAQYRRYIYTVVSVEPLDNFTKILRFLVSNRDSSGAVVPIAFARQYAQRVQNKVIREKPSGTFESSNYESASSWKLVSAVEFTTKNWRTVGFGGLRFHIDGEYKLNRNRARYAADYYDSIRIEFGVFAAEIADIYVAVNRDEMTKIIGLDYYLHPPNGFVYGDRNLVLSGISSEFHPHELAHVLFKEFRGSHKFFVEGIATLVGGSMNESFEEHIQRLKDEKLHEKFPKIREILARPQEFQFELYAIGALICKDARERGGNTMLKRLLSTTEFGDSDAAFWHKMHDVLGVDEQNIDSYVQSLLLNYALK